MSPFSVFHLYGWRFFPGMEHCHPPGYFMFSSLFLFGSAVERSTLYAEVSGYTPPVHVPGLFILTYVLFFVPLLCRLSGWVGGWLDGLV